MSHSYKPKKSSQEAIFNVLRQISYTKLFKKYSSGNFSFNKICINNLIFNENCLVVSRFKDFLIYDDNTEFFRRFYPIKDSFPKLEHILSFYEKYSKIFPNYLILKENKYLYRNIRKKQKMIDALNELKREERENRKKLKNKEYSKDKRNQGSQLNELFTKNIKNEIKNYQKNISFQNYKNSFDSETDKNNEDTLLINQNSISIYYKQLKEEKENKYKDENNAESFVTNQTNGSISNIVNVLNDNKIYICDLPNILLQNSNNNNTQKNKINKKQSGKKESNYNSVKAFNRNINKEEIGFQPTKHIRNNSLIKRKKIADKNNLYKNALTSTNATNSSSILSKKIKNQQTSPVNRAAKDNIKKSNENNVDKNLYQKTTPNFSHFELTRNKKQVNNNDQRKNDDRSTKENIQINKVDNPKKEKYKINKEIVKKKYIKCKHISQDFDSNLYSKMTENILNKNSKLNTNENSINMNMLNTENIIYQTCKNLVTTQNPNLITGDTKSNERNEKNFMEDKLIVNVRDKIEREKEKEKENEKKNKKEFLTEQKPKTNKKNKSIFKLIKSNPSSKGVLKTKTFNIKDTKIKLFNTLENNFNNNLKFKKSIEVIYEQDNNKNSMLRNKSAISKQKTDIKFGNKNRKFLTKDQKTKTKAIFANKLKFIDKSKKLLKSMESISKSKGVFKRINGDKDIKDRLIKDKEKEKSKEKSKKKEISINNSKKLFDIKFGSRHDIKNKNSSEKGMMSNLSDVHIYKYKANFTPYKSQTKKSKLNSKLTNCDSDKKYKSFLVKTKSKINEVFNRNSHKELYPFNFLNKLQSIKQNKTNTDFYHTLKIKSSKFINMDNSSNSVNKVKNNRNSTKMIYNGSFITTPNIKNRKNNFLKNHLSKRLNINNNNRNKKKDEISNNCLSSFSIKVNKTHYNKNEDRNSKSKSKDLKKTWTNNMKNLINQIDSNI